MSINGESKASPLELSETLRIATTDGSELPFEVVGILEDPDDGTSYAVLMHEPPDEDEGESEFIVTDLDGKLLDNDELAQEILDEFFVFAEESDDDGGKR